MLRKCALCAVLLYISLAGTNSEHIPVLMWQPGEFVGKNTESPPSLARVSSDQFSDYLSKKIHGRKHVVVFLEENLSLEDFGGSSVDDGYSFSRIRNITSLSDVDFLPSVQSPVKALKNLGLKMKSLSPKDFDNSFPSGEKSVLVFNLGDARIDEDRLDFLKRHDAIIADLYSKFVNKYDDPIAVYTGHHSSWLEPYLKPSVRRVRHLLETRNEGEAVGTLWYHNSTLVYFKAPPIFRNGTEEYNVTNVISLTSSSKANTAMLSVRTGDVSMKLTFTKSRGYWEFTQVEVFSDNTQSTILFPTVPITAPLRFSYHCSANVVFKDKGVANLTFYGLQVEPFHESNDSFSDAYDCVPFFSAPIWSGIFVTAILAFVMIWALTMIMDIKTMDQFDNPKGKTITISATD